MSKPTSAERMLTHMRWWWEVSVKKKKKKKTAWEKMRCGKKPHVVAEYRGRSMLVSSPEEVESVMAVIPRGRVMTLTELREELARRHGAETTCAMSTAIFANIVARAWEERERETGEPGVPWWRLLRADGKLNPKFPGGAAEQARRLAGEGLELDA
jgi:alkylated DNA nucleotide flippase Atl1